MRRKEASPGMRGAQSSVFSSLDRIGDVPLRRFTGAHDGPRQVMTEGRLRYESIFRFRRQEAPEVIEAPAVILVDVDSPHDREGRERAEEELLFCGCTPATGRLDVVARDGNPFTDRVREAAR